MRKLISRLAAIWILSAGLLATHVATAQTRSPDAPGLAGEWTGALTTPGGSRPIQISIVQLGANRLNATFLLSDKSTTRTPASLTLRGNDTIVVYAATVDSRFVCLVAADGQALRGIWSQPGLRVPLTLSRATAPGGAAVASQRMVAAATTYHTEQVVITSQPGSVPLAGTLSIPDGAGPFPAAVLLSDMGSQNRDAATGTYRMFANLAGALARQGIAVLRLDDRGVGESGGDGQLATTANLVHDAAAGLSYLRLRPSLDPLRTGFIGHGEGGNVALLAAAQPLPPSFVVTLATAGVPGLELLAAQAEPVGSAADTAQAGADRRQAWAAVLAKAANLRTSGANAAQVDTYLGQQRLKVKSADRQQAAATLKFRTTMLEIVRQTANNDQAQAIVVNMLHQRYPTQDPAVARARAVELTKPWYRYYLQFDPRLGLADVHCPVLLLHGTDDAEVNAAVNLTALESGLRANKRAVARRLPGVNHLFQTPAAERLAAADGSVDVVIDASMLNAVRDFVLVQSK